MKNDTYDKDQVKCLDITYLIIVVVTENDMIINLQDFLLKQEIQDMRNVKVFKVFTIQVRNLNGSKIVLRFKIWISYRSISWSQVLFEIASDR